MDPRRVLVVTDIDLVGWALRQALTSSGFVVLTAGDAEAARALIHASDPFDVVIVSLSLGAERVAGLLDEAARLWPAVPAIVLGVDPEPCPLETQAVHVVLEKPYSVANVVAMAGRFCGASEGLTCPAPDNAGPVQRAPGPVAPLGRLGGGPHQDESQAGGAHHRPAGLVAAEHDPEP